MQFQELGWTHAEGVAYITLHRPERRNAMTTVMLAELLYALEHCASESAVRVVVLQGAGTGFCAGDDLAGMGSLPDGFAYQPQHSLTHAGLQTCLMGLPKPVVAVLHGFAFGVGLDVAMACDFRIAADNVQLRDQRVIERGMHAVTGCAWLQQRCIGQTRAMQFLMLGEALDGKRAQDWGMVTRSVAPDELNTVVSEMAKRLAQAPTKALGLMKQQIHSGQSMSHGEFMDFAQPLIKQVHIRDREEGIQAFLEKREARFTGE
jgi:2-(1,2-epoxy-1,2-dihydrophenyl)acetyl-CoA isomerase